MAVSTKSLSDGKLTLEVVFELGGSMLESEETIQSVLNEAGTLSMANSQSRFRRQLVEPAAVRLPAEMVQYRLRVNGFAADFSCRMAT